MASHTRLSILAFTVGTWLMVRETVAMETLARSATVRMSINTGFFLGPRADLVFLVGIWSRRECVYRIRPPGKKSRIKRFHGAAIGGCAIRRRQEKVYPRLQAGGVREDVRAIPRILC